MYLSHQQNYPPSRPMGQPPAPAPTPLPIAIPPNPAYPQYSAGNTMPPPSPSQTSEANDEGNYNLPGPPPKERIYDGRGWSLEIIQQPKRARMCGFGDKDRRPISPPPCIRLKIFDPKTGKEIDYEKVADLSKLVLGVDLWNLHGSREDNCVKNNTTSPSISSTNTTAYPATVTGPTPSSQQVQLYNGNGVPTYATQQFTSPTTSGPPSASAYYPNDARTPSFQYSNDSRYSGQYQNGYDPSYVSRSSTQGSISSSANTLRSARSSQDLGQPKDGHVAKNLIGSSISNAFRLTDDQGKVGLWFVLQDLSVRTEGWFRLKMDLFLLSELVLTEQDNAVTIPVELLDEAPCLATAFSAPFKVYSAKKFPGVIETTPLSRQFAKQGIKIPIRKDGNNKRKRGKDGDDGDGYDDGDDWDE